MEQTRNRILTAALELFSKNGYAGTTTREIAQRADLTEVTLFRYFNSKEAIFESTILNYLPSPDFELLISKANEMEYKEALQFIAKSFFDGLKANKNLINIMYKEMQRHFELMDRLYTALIKNLLVLLQEYFTQLQEREVLRKIDASVMATTFLGIFISLFEYDDAFLNSNSDSDIIYKKIEAMVDIFINGTQKS